MPNTFTDHRDRWLLMSDIDYLGQFVKAWLAFNAWYRSAYSENQDRKIIEEIKWSPNQILSKFRPLMERTSEEAEQFRNEIGLLHNRLENYELHTGKGAEKIRIRMRNVVIRIEPPITEQFNYRNYQFEIKRSLNGDVHVSVKAPNGSNLVNLQQLRYDRAGLEADTGFIGLTDNLRRRCLSCYDNANPRLPRDLTIGHEAPISCGTYEFNCGPDFLFAGVLEIIYLMRCSLFHGELMPTREASECYEPAYRIVRRFFQAIT